MGGETEWEGRLEVCLSQRWGSVSSRAGDGWPADNVQVVCRDLGYETSNTSTSRPYYNVLVLLLNTTALSKYSFVMSNFIEAVTSTHRMLIFVMHKKACCIGQFIRFM